MDRLRSDTTISGTIETERKTGERIGDIRCQLTESPSDMPRQFVVEIETPESDKNRRLATIDHLRHGYAVYWVFTLDAATARRTTEQMLEEFVSPQPSLGVASLADGELSLGSPLTWTEFAYQPPLLGATEVYIPTYDRYEEWYCHGDFEVDSQRVSVLRKPGSQELFISHYTNEGQQTLPQRSSLSMVELRQRIQKGDVIRRSPVRGPP